ncbi:hypothetical protein AVEN_66966-1 [Araneus ventricosus]|uniref:Uncharacterized protein n=1 Tax=Araneus ventricosus TaxID=182803 RepID=A0A4Y2SYZ8_ARAVE|nr:hypothetical protein AVEN_66966-1 [Araneus ventricosus]
MDLMDMVHFNSETSIYVAGNRNFHGNKMKLKMQLFHALKCGVKNKSHLSQLLLQYKDSKISNGNIAIFKLDCDLQVEAPNWPQNGTKNASTGQTLSKAEKQPIRTKKQNKRNAFYCISQIFHVCAKCHRV